MVFRLIYNNTVVVEQGHASPETKESVESCALDKKRIRGAERG